MVKIYGLRTKLVRVSTVRGLSKALPAERWLETWDAAGRLASRAQLPCTPVVSDSERAAYTARLFHLANGPASRRISETDALVPAKGKGQG
jgi:hypothetical protein